jgi:hypothetical protein
MSSAVAHAESLLGVSISDDEIPQKDAEALQIAWEAQEVARAELDNGYPLLNAQALVSVNSALDAFIEAFVPAILPARGFRIVVETLVWERERRKGAAPGPMPDSRGLVARTHRGNHVAFGLTLPKLKRLAGRGAQRYEVLLSQIGLGAPSDRPLPEDLDLALRELGVLRNVLVHRGGRIDRRALDQAPSLRFADGSLLRISDSAYDVYSAAVRCYAREVVYRYSRVAGSDADAPDLAAWREC